MISHYFRGLPIGKTYYPTMGEEETGPPERYVYGSLVTDSTPWGKCYIIGGGIIEADPEYLLPFCWTQVYPSSIGEYIYFEDSTGLQIYTKDKVSHVNFPNEVFVVKKTATGFCFGDYNIWDEEEASKLTILEDVKIFRKDRLGPGWFDWGEE